MDIGVVAPEVLGWKEAAATIVAPYAQFSWTKWSCDWLMPSHFDSNARASARTKIEEKYDWLIDAVSKDMEAGKISTEEAIARSKSLEEAMQNELAAYGGSDLEDEDGVENQTIVEGKSEREVERAESDEDDDVEEEEVDGIVTSSPEWRPEQGSSVCHYIFFSRDALIFSLVQSLSGAETSMRPFR